MGGKPTEETDAAQKEQERIFEAERSTLMRGYHETGDLKNAILLQSDHESMETKIATDIQNMTVPPVDGEAPEDVTDWEATARAMAKDIVHLGRHRQTVAEVLDDYRVLRDQI